MNNAAWQFVGDAGVTAFAVAIVLSFVAKRLFVSSRKKDVNLGRQIISAMGGARNARIASEEIARRRMAQ
jgi:hypothetical protein